MERDDRELGAIVQAQETKIKELEDRLGELDIDTGKNRTATRDRPIMSKKPLRNEGKDADHRFFDDSDGKRYYSVKVNGRWVKMEVSDV